MMKFELRSYFFNKRAVVNILIFQIRSYFFNTRAVVNILIFQIAALKQKLLEKDSETYLNRSRRMYENTSIRCVLYRALIFRCIKKS